MPLRRSPFALGLLVAAAVLATLALGFVLYAVTRRPDNPVEAELVFESLRVGRGWPLYVDPAIGAWEDGGPPSRFYVLYTPIWPWLVGHLGGADVHAIRVTGRVLATIAWLLIFTLPVILAPRARRRTVGFAALLGLGIYFLTRNAPSATPDTLAVAFSCIGLVRVAKRGRVDAVSAVLVSIAPLVKPSCLGVLAGLTVAHLACRKSGRIAPILAGASAALVVALFCHVVSDGTWLTHIVRSTGQPLTATRFVEQLGSRVVVLGIPHVAIAILAIRGRAPFVVTAPLVTSIVWSSFAMAKHGSGTQYWLEPTMAALVAVAFVPCPRTARAYRFAAAALGMLTVTIAVTSVHGYWRELEEWHLHDAELALLDRHCVRDAGEVVVSSEVGVELALDGRILVPDWQSSILARLGKFPAEAWRADLRDPHARWLVLPFDLDESPVDTNDARIEFSGFRDVVRPAVEDAFVRDTRIGRFFVYRRRDDAELPSRATHFWTK